ncbi:hypothetical protein GCM10027277_26080 [Pseudoduganella ginsengisoli]|uniref:Restriction endonuclease type IV Mrr domain-containing protein n=1 Tax=Pseudoduganella ginsengisoli TaxID=1462440 RepID=A0A6L6PYJ2_9BURK|nr:restriction endonuclease [Pseudoduganella ginsengisoli]MTW02673.1 hypothetical protein [Pseudoduganella ginsengisoli]
MKREQASHAPGQGRNDRPSANRHAPHLVGWDAAWAARFRRWSRALGRLAIRWCSLWVNLTWLSYFPGHQHNVRRSRRVLRKVRGFKEPGAGARCLAYLRRIDPLLFEEVIMSALEDAGLFVLRSQHYGGDGGGDGVVWIPGRGWCSVLCNRFRGQVHAADVRAIAWALAKSGYDGGLLVHSCLCVTALHAQLDTARIALLGGDRLLRLIRERVLECRWPKAKARAAP